MKKIFLLSASILCVSIGLFAQTFYIEKTPDGFEQPIIDKLLKLEYKVTSKQENSDYTIQCFVTKKRAGTAISSIIISNSKSGDVLKKSEEVKTNYSAVNGFNSVKIKSMKKIAKNYLAELLQQLKR